MDTFMRYENQLLLEYVAISDSYKISFDEGYAFPYEAYDKITLNNHEYYILMLDNKNQYPIVAEDKWLELSDVQPFILNHKSKTEEGTTAMKNLLKLIDAAMPLL